LNSYEQKIKVRGIKTCFSRRIQIPKESTYRCCFRNIRSLNNIGSFFRTSDAFGIEAIYLCGITAVPPHREIQKTALGATESVDWKYFETTEKAIEELKANDYSVYAIEQTENSVYLQNVEYNMENVVLVFGNEVDGVGQNIINQSKNSIEIPQLGTKHSLNVSISSGVVLWHLVGQTLTK